MSVIVTVRVSGEPSAFEEQVTAQAEAIGRIMDVAKRHGLIAHRWYGAEGEFMAIDEWPDGETSRPSSTRHSRTSARSCRRRASPHRLT